MKILKCPVCGKEGFGFFEKMGIDFLKTIRCKHCASELQHYDHVRHLFFFFENILAFVIWIFLFLFFFSPYLLLVAMVVVTIGLVSYFKRLRFLRAFYLIIFLSVIFFMSLLFIFESDKTWFSDYFIIAAMSYISIRLIALFLPLKKKEE